MGCLKCLAVPVALLAALLFYLNEPLPPNTANPIKYKIVAGICKLQIKYAEIQAWYTGEDFRVIEQDNLAAMTLSHRINDPDVLVSEEKFAGVHVYIYQPKIRKENRPALIYFHGGGFRTGHPVGYESMIVKFVKQLDMVVVVPDYRLTPKVKAPVPHEDCEKATQHFFINAAKYGVDPNLVGVAGDSAGGNLAASLSLTLRDQGEDQFAFQLLIYPWVQGLDMQTPSYQRNSEDALVFLKYEAMSSYLGSFLGVPPRVFPELFANKHVKPETWEKYEKYFKYDEIPKESKPSNFKPVRPKEINQALAEFVEEDLTNPYLFPLLADDLSNLPPAYVLVVENDPIRDEAIWFANRLKRAGNVVEYDYSPDGFHGMIGMQKEPFRFDSAVKATDNMINFAQKNIKDFKKIHKEVKEENNANVADEKVVETKDTKTEKKQKPLTATKDSAKNIKTNKPKVDIPKPPPAKPLPAEKKSEPGSHKVKNGEQKIHSDAKKSNQAAPKNKPSAKKTKPVK